VGVPTIEGFTPRIAGRFVTESFVAGGIHRKTANRKISVASSYWRWLVKRAGIAANPWAGQSLSKRVPAGGASLKPRPFTDAEMVTLLGGKADAELADAMRCAALSGVRIEELYRLTVATVAGGWFDIGEAKSDAGVRRVPIHPDLADIVTRRCAGKAPSAYLFHEAGALRPGRERSMAASKRFGHYRKREGVDDRAEGARQSRTTFHSFRRWFVTKARAGFDLAVVQAIVGHESGNLTDDVYSGGPSDEAKRACAESVKLPVAG
jgi:integrase